MSEEKLIPFNRPSLQGHEIEYVTRAVLNGHISGDGQFTKKCHAYFEKELGCARALLTTSCTHALEMSAILGEIGAGDEVIVPSFTFVSTVNAFVLRGAVPVFCDIRPDTLNLDERQLESLITPRTKAIVPVHYAGVGCEMDEICEIANRHDLMVIEDNAHGLFGKYKEKLLGTFGVMATQSFHETKNITCGEGGALIINNPQLAARAEVIREKGTNRSQFFRGEVNKYGWVDIGSSYLPSDALAGFLFAQLEHATTIQRKRQAIWKRYAEALGDWAGAAGVRLPFVPATCEQAWHMFYLICPNLSWRTRFIKSLRERGVHSVFHYLPLDSSEMGKRVGRAPNGCPVTAEMSDRIVRLPLYADLSEEEQSRVIDSILGFDYRG
ncbi:dTDP-4-amino-4,6-dideoxygalactose transaminase [Candidatus Sumerlaeota bacterium]|nr:dTDP-4-amino-4,6-dideoxygalactose transaminase [Candidatus Sumerlaeota bacterium]